MYQFKKYGPSEGPRDKFIQFFLDSDNFFDPSLSSRTNLLEYSEKMFQYGTKYIFVFNDEIISCCVCYLNKYPLKSFITYVLTLPDFKRKGLGSSLIKKCISDAEKFLTPKIELKMNGENLSTLRFYSNLGFLKTAESMFPNTKIKELELTKFFDINDVTSKYTSANK